MGQLYRISTPRLQMISRKMHCRGICKGDRKWQGTSSYLKDLCNNCKIILSWLKMGFKLSSVCSLLLFYNLKPNLSKLCCQSLFAPASAEFDGYNIKLLGLLSLYRFRIAQTQREGQPGEEPQGQLTNW